MRARENLRKLKMIIECLNKKECVNCNNYRAEIVPSNLEEGIEVEETCFLGFDIEKAEDCWGFQSLRVIL